MTLATVKLLYDHGDWATRVLLDAAEGLPLERWTAEAGPGVRPIADNVAHMIQTVNNWRSWWDGSQTGEQAFSGATPPPDLADVAAARAAWADATDRLNAYVAGLSEAETQRVLSVSTAWGMTIAGPLWQMLVHLALHGAQHRAEIAAQLSAQGRSPGEIDLGAYLWLHGAGRAA